MKFATKPLYGFDVRALHKLWSAGRISAFGYNLALHNERSGGGELLRGRSRSWCGYHEIIYGAVVQRFEFLVIS